MPRKAKKEIAQASFRARSVSNPYGLRNKTRNHSNVTKNINGKEQLRLLMTAKDTPLQKDADKTEFDSEINSSSPSIDFYNRVPELAEIARRLHMTGEPATSLQISAASEFLASSKWSVEDLKDSEPFEDIGTKLGLERMRREIIIFQHIGEVSFSLLEQNLIHNNELDVFQQTVISWMDLLESSPSVLANLPARISRHASVPSAAEDMRAYLEGYMQMSGFKRWSFSRLKMLARYTSDMLPSNATTKVTPSIEFFTAIQNSSASSNTTRSVLHSSPLKSISAPAVGTKSESKSIISSDSFMLRYEEIPIVVQEYSFDLEIEKSRILNTILHKQNILREARAEANQARAAFDKGSLLSDLQTHLLALQSKEIEWTVEAAGDFGEILFEFGRISRDLVQEGLVRILHAEKQAENDLEDYLRLSPDAAILAGAKAVLNELVGLRGTLS